MYKNVKSFEKKFVGSDWTPQFILKYNLTLIRNWKKYETQENVFAASHMIPVHVLVKM
jgi:hypothetical protein